MSAALLDLLSRDVAWGDGPGWLAFLLVCSVVGYGIGWAATR